MTQIIGKNTLSGTAANWNTDAQCQMLTGLVATTLTADQELTEYHLGYGDVGGTGTSTVQVALYDTTSGYNGATLIAGTTQTFTLDHDALTGDQWVSITGLSVDLSSYNTKRLAILLTSPGANGLGVILETVAGSERNKSIVSTTPPATHAQSGTSTNTFALYAVTETAAASLSADSITAGTIRAGDTVTINLSNASNATGKTLSIPQGALTATAQDINSISFTAPDLKTFGDKTGDYSTNITIAVTDGAESDTIAFQVAPDVGDESGAITADEGIYGEAAFSGVVVTDLYYTTTISGADFSVGAVPVLGTEQVFSLWIQDQTDGVWGTPFEVTIPASATASESAMILRDVLKPVLSSVIKETFEE